MFGGEDARGNLSHRNDDGVGAERHGKTLTARLQIDHHAVGVFQPHLALALVTVGRAVARLAVGAGKLAQFLQIVDVAIGFHLGDAEPADTQAADRETVVPALIVERAAADVSAAEKGHLDLLDGDRPRLDPLLGDRRRCQQGDGGPDKRLPAPQ